jgi:hypothetical protein
MIYLEDGWAYCQWAGKLITNKGGTIMYLVIASMLLALSGCGTMMNGLGQDVTITSSPGNGTAYVDGVAVGMTPVSVHMSRKHAHVVRVEQPGYYPAEASITQSESEWILANMANLYIGHIVDSISGGMYDLHPTQVNTYFRPLPNALASSNPVVGTPLSTKATESVSVPPTR